MDPTFMFGHLDPTNRFVMEGLNMAFTREPHRDGKPLPKLLFVDVMVKNKTKINQTYQPSPPWTFIDNKHWREFGSY